MAACHQRSWPLNQPRLVTSGDALCGNAVLPLIYGYVSDHMSLQTAYWLLVPCFAYMIFYAVYGYKIEKW